MAVWEIRDCPEMSVMNRRIIAEIKVLLKATLPVSSVRREMAMLRK